MPEEKADASRKTDRALPADRRAGRLQLAVSRTDRRARVGQSIKREIEAAGVSVSALSNEIGISRTNIHNVLEGRSQITAVFAVRLAAALESRRLSASDVPAIHRVRRRAIGLLLLGSQMDVDAVLRDSRMFEMIQRLLGRTEKKGSAPKPAPKGRLGRKA